VRPIWKTLYFEKGGYLLIRDQKDVVGTVLTTDTVKHILKWKFHKEADSVFMHYTINSDTMALRGIMGKDSVLVHLRKKDTDHYPLMERGFRWVNETPFNK
jgi:hypothetical protein